MSAIGRAFLFSVVMPGLGSGICGAPLTRCTASGTRGRSRLTLPVYRMRRSTKWCGADPGPASRFARPERSSLRFEETIRSILRGAFFCCGLLQPPDLGGQQRNPLSQFLDRQQREVLPDLVSDFLARPIVFLDGHGLVLSRPSS